MVEIGYAAVLIAGKGLNNRAETSHQPFRQWERTMSRFRDIKPLQKFASIHAALSIHFNLERHLTSRTDYKQNRSAAMAEWYQVLA
jgi:putative transposase